MFQAEYHNILTCYLLIAVYYVDMSSYLPVVYLVVFNVYVRQFIFTCCLHSSPLSLFIYFLFLVSTPIQCGHLDLSTVHEVIKAASTLTVLALEKEFDLLFIYVNTWEVKHIERTVQAIKVFVD